MIENEYNKKHEKKALIANAIAKKQRNIRKVKPIIYGDLLKKRKAETENKTCIKDN